MNKFFINSLLPMLVLLVIVFVLTLVPYFSTQHQLQQTKRTEVYLCKFSSIMAEFVTTAADARLSTARQSGDQPIQQINLKAARVYIHVRNELDRLPPSVDCKALTKGSK